MPLPNDKDIEALLRKTFRQVVLSPSVSLTRVVSSMKGMSHADVERVALDSIKQMILKDRSEIDQPILDESIRRERERLSLSTQAAPNRRPSRSRK